MEALFDKTSKELKNKKNKQDMISHDVMNNSP
jgi:hypothetical protein